MNAYQESKKARRVAAIVYLVFMAFILGGTLLSQTDKVEQSEKHDDSKIKIVS